MSTCIDLWCTSTFLFPAIAARSLSSLSPVIRFIVKARAWGLDWSHDTLVNESLISRGRNALVARALMNPLASHIFFLDADIGFEPENITALLAEDVDIIGGGYPKKSLPIDYVINPASSGSSDDSKAEVDRIGTGSCFSNARFSKRWPPQCQSLSIQMTVALMLQLISICMHFLRLVFLVIVCS